MLSNLAKSSQLPFCRISRITGLSLDAPRSALVLALAGDILLGRDDLFVHRQTIDSPLHQLRSAHPRLLHQIFYELRMDGAQLDMKVHGVRHKRMVLGGLWSFCGISMVTLWVTSLLPYRKRCYGVKIQVCTIFSSSQEITFVQARLSGHFSFSNSSKVTFVTMHRLCVFASDPSCRYRSLKRTCAKERTLNDSDCGSSIAHPVHPVYARRTQNQGCRSAGHDERPDPGLPQSGMPGPASATLRTISRRGPAPKGARPHA